MTLIKKIFPLMAVLLLAAGAGHLHAAGRKATPLSDSMRKTSKYPSAATKAAFRNFTQKHGAGWRVRYSPRTALPEALVGGSTSRYPGTPEQAAAAFFADNGALLQVDPLALRLTQKTEFMGITHLQYQQYKDGIPVEFSYARVHVASDGSVTGYQSKFEPAAPAAASPSVPEQAAVLAASADLGRSLALSKAELVYYPGEDSDTLKLAWKLRGRASGGIWVYYVDAVTGAVLFKYDDMRHICPGTWTTYGSSSGTIYAISPIPENQDSASMTEITWDAPTVTPLRDQYVWVNSYASMTVTNQYGDYCANQSGKVFSSLKGPFFSVTNFRGKSAHWDNDGDAWVFQSAQASSPHPYENSASSSYSVPLSYDTVNKAFAKAMPHFTASSQVPFQVGSMELGGSITDGDELYVHNPSLTNGDVVGAYIGRRTVSFYGAAVENPGYLLDLETDASGTFNGFVSDGADVLLFPKANTTNNATGSVVWAPANVSFMDTTYGAAYGLSEVNAFYHLNKMHRYFDPINIDPNNGNKAAADLSKRIAVMVHAHGDADTMNTDGGMTNAFYDLERDNIMLGDGPLVAGSYRSFALDGTIVRHEYTHAVVNHIYPIINFGEFGAVSEALADYFSLASLWSEGRSITKLGNFIGAGEASVRNISGGAPTGVKVMPGDWMGEVHDDSRMLSQALYDLHFNNPNDGTTSNLGVFTGGPFNGLYKADVLVYAALFYFPDNFSNLYDAMSDVCRQIDTKWGGVCDASSVVPKITSAFVAHGIGPAAVGDSYEVSPVSALCQNNNGPECATDVSSMTSLSATVSPVGDVDFYSLTLAAGQFSASLKLPVHAYDSAGNPSYEAYAMFLFDSERNIVIRPDGTEAVASPHLDLPAEGEVCQNTDPCYTFSETVTLNYSVQKAGRYYLAVSATPNGNFGNSNGSSQVPYTLTLSRSPSGSSTARIYSASFDNDQISFEVPYNKFAADGWPSSTTAGTPSYPDLGTETVFQYAQLRDQDFVPIPLTRTDMASSYLKENPASRSYTTDIFGNPVLSGMVQLQPGFAARYPGVGTVYLEIFGRNHLGTVVSLGVSGAVNLTASAAEATAYNNIITGAGGSALIKYAVMAAGSLSIKVYTQTGALVKTVYSGPVAAGKGTYEWDGTNSGGGKVASGIYFVKVKGPGLDSVVKIAVVR
jgi:Zn-dependent metalloprotease